MPSCSLSTFCAALLVGLGLALGWGFGLFIVAQVTRLLVKPFV